MYYFKRNGVILDIQETLTDDKMFDIVHDIKLDWAEGDVITVEHNGRIVHSEMAEMPDRYNEYVDDLLLNK